MKKILILCFSILVLLSLNFVSSAPARDILPVQTQVVSGTQVITGQFDFAYNFSRSNTCSPVIFSKTFFDNITDSRGIVNFNIEVGNSLNFSEQLFACVYIDNILDEVIELAKAPNSFYTKNISSSGIVWENETNFNGRNLTNVGTFIADFIGTIINRITKIWVIDIDVNGTINVTNAIINNANITNLKMFGDIDVNSNQILNIAFLNLTQDINLIDKNWLVPTPILGNHTANKNYVDDATSSTAFDFFLHDEVSNIAGFFNLTELDGGEAESTLSTGALGEGTFQIFNWTTFPNVPEFNEIRQGVYNVHIHLNDNGPGKKPITITPKLYNISSDGSTRNLLVTFETINTLTSIPIGYDLHGVLSENIMLVDGDRLNLELEAEVGAGGGDVTVTITMEGTTDSHLSIQTSTNAFEQIFIRRDGTNTLTGNWQYDTVTNPFNFNGSGNFTTTGWINAVNLNITGTSYLGDFVFNGNVDVSSGNVTADWINSNYINTSIISYLGKQAIISNTSVAGDVSLTIRNTAPENAVIDESVSILAQTTPNNYKMGKIVFKRSGDYGTSLTRDAQIEFYAVKSNNYVLSATFGEDGWWDLNDNQMFNIDGIRVGENSLPSADNIEIKVDNGKFRAGATLTDLEWYSDGTDGNIDTTGDLNLGITGGNIITSADIDLANDFSISKDATMEVILGIDNDGVADLDDIYIGGINQTGDLYYDVNNIYLYAKTINLGDAATTDGRVDINGDLRIDSNLGIGKDPDASFRLDITDSSTSLLRATNTASSSSGAGAGLQFFHNDGAAMASGDRLGFFTFGGAEDGSDTTHNAAAISSFATEAWSSSANGAEIRFETTADGTTTRSVRMVIGQDGDVNMTGNQIFGSTITPTNITMYDSGGNPWVCGVNLAGVFSCG